MHAFFTFHDASYAPKIGYMGLGIFYFYLALVGWVDS